MLNRILMALLLAFLLPHTARAWTSHPRTEVGAGIDKLFDGMRAADTGTIRSTFSRELRLAITTFREGQPVVQLVTSDDFIASIGSAMASLDEQVLEGGFDAAQIGRKRPGH